MPIDPKPRPRAFRLGPLGPANAENPSAPLVIETLADPYEAEVRALMAGPDASEAAVEAAQKEGVAARSLLSWGSLFWSATGGLVSLGFALWLARLIDDLFAWSPAFGLIGLVLAAVAGTALLVLGAREIGGVLRQRHVAELHIGLAQAREKDDFKEARRLIEQLSSLYAARPEAARARSHLRQLAQDIVDGSDLIDIAERTLVEPLDMLVQHEIAIAAKRVSMVTTLAPRAIIDVIFVAAQAVRLIRRIATIYGGRPGLFGFLKLLRSIASHLAITGGMAAGDSLLQQFVGHGIAAKVSARLGEGVLNGLLTARVGLSAMSVCRPLPFAIKRPPGISDVAPFLFRGDKKE
ncbi:MAG TPA: TIGR01620 family protein [Methylocella sp.]|nr:TIGR01620 family protein [Methylocella sp.]